jgi:hypothetical protein
MTSHLRTIVKNLSPTESTNLPFSTHSDTFFTGSVDIASIDTITTYFNRKHLLTLNAKHVKLQMKKQVTYLPTALAYTT